MIVSGRSCAARRRRRRWRPARRRARADAQVTARRMRGGLYRRARPVAHPCRSGSTISHAHPALPALRRLHLAARSRATSSPCSTTRRGAERRRDAAPHQRDELRREHVPAAGRDAPAPTSACASSRRRARCRWPGIPPSAPPSRWPIAAMIAPGRERWTFGLNIGPTPVALDWKDGALRHGLDGSGRAGVPSAGHAGRGRRCDAIGADRTEWKGTGWPVEEGIVRRAVLLRAAGDPRGGRCVRARRRGDAAAEERVPGGPHRRVRVQRRRAPATGPRSTAGCSRRRPAWSRTRPPAAPAARSGRISCGTASSPLAKRPAHRQRAGRQDGPPEPPAHPRRGDRGAARSPASTSAARRSMSARARSLVMHISDP